MTVHTSYLISVYDRETYKRQLEKAANILKEIQKETPFDTIAFTGTSGAAFAYPLSHILDVSLMCVRKTNENCHYHTSVVEGYGASTNFIIVDDFMSSGDTLRRILKEVKKFYLEVSKRPLPNFLGTMFYNYDNDKIVKYESENSSYLACLKGHYK